MHDQQQYQRHSVWICPAAEAKEQLCAEVGQIARLTGTASFAPHMTLLGDIGSDPAKTATACRALFAGRSAISARVRDIGMTERFFMSLFLDLAVPAWLPALRRDLADRVGVPPTAAFSPHLSLAYGYDPAVHGGVDVQALVQKYEARVIDFPVVVIAASASDIPIEEWQVIESFVLPKAPC